MVMKKGKGGRPKLWDQIMDDSKLTLVEGWKRDGLSDEQVAKNLGVSKTTIHEWKNQYPEFATAIKKGREVSDYELENTLHKRAMGYYYTEEVVTNKGEIVTVRKFEHPNPTSLIFALKNKLPAKYRDKHNIEHSGGTHNTNTDLSYLSDDELEKALKKYGDQ